MAADDDLTINTLHRFAKRSRLVLHEYSHCEVPAGCGGVILRWIDPAQGYPCSARLLGMQGTVWLDGRQLASSVALLGAGDHVVALEIVRPADPREPRLWSFGIAFEDAEDRDVVQRAGTRWRESVVDPIEGEWWAPDFDDAAWTPLEPAPIVGTAVENWPRQRFEQAANAGQEIFTIPDGVSTQRVRVAFRVPERTT